MSDDDRFCPYCDVVVELHDGDDSCEQAEDNAQRLERLERLMFGPWPR
jgi:hypothetical protein